jgi:hypothetical protein
MWTSVIERAEGAWVTNEMLIILECAAIAYLRDYKKEPMVGFEHSECRGFLVRGEMRTLNIFSGISFQADVVTGSKEATCHFLLAPWAIHLSPPSPRSVPYVGRILSNGEMAKESDRVDWRAVEGMSLSKIRRH